MESSLTHPRTIGSRLLVTLAIVAAYRLGTWIPLPGVDPDQIQTIFSRLGPLAWWQALGSPIERFSVFALGLLPYLNAAILWSLIAFPSAKLRALFLGHEKTFSWGLWALTLLLGLVQAAGTSFVIASQNLTTWEPWAFSLINIPVLTAGAFVLIWLGSLINRYGIGNGWAILLASQVFFDWPRFIAQLGMELQQQGLGAFWGAGLAVLFVLVLIVSVWALRGTRQLAGAERAVTLPWLSVGIIPLYLASWLLTLVSFGLSGVAPEPQGWWQELSRDFVQSSWGYIVSYGVLVLLCTYLYRNAILHPDDLQAQSVPALGAALFLGALAILPLVLSQLTGLTTYFIGGMGVLLVVGVLVDAASQARLSPPLVGVSRTFSHARAHEIKARLTKAGIPSVLQTVIPYPYLVFPMLGPVEVSVPNDEQSRAQGLLRDLGPESHYRHYAYWFLLVLIVLISWIATVLFSWR